MKKGLSIIAGIAILLFAYSVSAAVETNGLVSWWKFEHGSGTTAYDDWDGKTNHTNDGTFGDNPVWTSRAADANNTPGPASSWALDFDGSNDYVNCGNDESLDITTGITLEVWAKPSSGGGDGWVVSKKDYDGAPYAAYGLSQIATSDKFRGTLNINGNGVLCDANDAFTTDQWYHIALTYNGTTAKLYIDGLLQTDEESATGTIKLVTHSVILGAWATNGDFFDGAVDEVRIYNRALTQPEITNNYNAIPEPSALLLLGTGLLGLSVFRLKRKD